MKFHSKGLTKIARVSLFLLFFSYFYSSPTVAENGQESGLSISPVVFEINSDQGDTLINQVKIYNPTDFPQNVKMQVEDFTPVGEEGQVVLDQPGKENSTYSLTSWTTVSPTEFVIDSKQQQVVNFTINVPQNGEPGGHYGSIVAAISGGKAQMTGSVTGTKRGSLILLRVSGNITEDVVIDTFEAKDFQEYGPVDFNLKFKNIGNVHVRPAGFITITDQFGKQVAQLDIPRNNVIPNAIRQAGTTWEEKNLMGRYTATMVANYGATSKQTVTSVITFTVFPWKKGLVVGTVILVFLLVLAKSRKRISLALKVLMGKH